MVWFKLKDYAIEHPSKNLSAQQSGPYKVFERVGKARRLDLPSSMSIHTVFSLDKLRKAANDLLLGQVEQPPRSLLVSYEKRWTVEKILDSKLPYQKFVYRVTWMGGEDDLT